MFLNQCKALGINPVFLNDYGSIISPACLIYFFAENLKNDSLLMSISNFCCYKDFLYYKKQTNQFYIFF